MAQGPTTATLMGVSRERIIMATFLIGGLLAGAAALLYTLKVPQGILYSGGFLGGSRRFRLRCSAASGTLGVPRWGLLLGIMENYGQAIFGIPMARRRRVRVARAGPSDPAHRDPR